MVDLKNKTVEELRKMASKKKIEGRSKMNKAELVRALKKKTSTKKTMKRRKMKGGDLTDDELDMLLERNYQEFPMELHKSGQVLGVQNSNRTIFIISSTCGQNISNRSHNLYFNGNGNDLLVAKSTNEPQIIHNDFRVLTVQDFKTLRNRNFYEEPLNIIEISEISGVQINIQDHLLVSTLYNSENLNIDNLEIYNDGEVLFYHCREATRSDWYNHGALTNNYGDPRNYNSNGERVEHYNNKNNNNNNENNN